MIKNYKAIFFDAGGTLLHPYPSVGQIYHEVARRYGCEAHPEFLQQTFHHLWIKKDGMSALVGHSSEKVEKKWWRELVHELFERAGGLRDFEAFFEELYDLFARPHVWRLYPEAVEVLECLKKEKKQIGIISNWDSRLFGLCEGLAITPYFDFILASAVFGAAKPSERIFEEALKKAGVHPSEAVHIGDSLEDDIRGAERAGIRAVLIDRGPNRSLQNHPLNHVTIIRDLRELLSNS
ncbi:MAG TPA: HAD-IA family hydrolase [bacterium]|nr:HAD-IA family hydrolase [bacterium]